MKWNLLMVLFSIGTAAGYGAWKENREYKYKLQSSTRNSDGGVSVRAHLFIYTQSKNLLVGRITPLEYVYSSDKNSSYQQPSRSPFKIHLENGAIHSISVDSKLTDDEINKLKVIISQLQVDTKPQNLIPSENDHLPKRGSNNAFYKTIESTFEGDCETTYDISTLSDYLVKSNPEWVPLPDLKGRGDFIKIEKTKNFNSCYEVNSYLSSYKNIQINLQSNYASASASAYDEMKTEQMRGQTNKRISSPIVTRIVVSGDLEAYTIQSSITIGNGGGFHDRIELTLESVEERTIQSMSRFEGVESYINVGNLVYGSDAQNHGLSVERSQILQGGGNCRKADDAPVQWSSCWTAFPTADTICKNEFTPEWEDIGSDCCGLFCWGKKARCRRSFPGCVSTVCYSAFVPQNTLCKDQYKDDYPVTCGGFVDCSPGFYGARCCPKSYQ